MLAKWQCEKMGLNQSIMKSMQSKMYPNNKSKMTGISIKISVDQWFWPYEFINFDTKKARLFLLCLHFVLSLSSIYPNFWSSLCPYFVITLSRLGLNFVLILSQVCPNFVLTLSQLCPHFVPCLCSICPNFVLILGPHLVLTMSWPCPHCVSTLSSLCPHFVPTLVPYTRLKGVKIFKFFPDWFKHKNMLRIQLTHTSWFCF